jgi:hypothetical protein
MLRSNRKPAAPREIPVTISADQLGALCPACRAVVLEVKPGVVAAELALVPAARVRSPELSTKAVNTP